MSETTQAEKRIAVVAKELNVGVSHLVEFLTKKGFAIENKPTAKISAPMYAALMQEFQQDKANKAQAEKISLGRPAPVTPVVTKEPERVIPASAQKKEEKEMLIRDNTSKAPVIPVPEKKVAPPKEEVKAAEEVKPAEETFKIKAPVLKGPKIVGKIDVDAKPKEAAKKTEEAPIAEETATEKKSKSKKKTEETPVAEEAPTEKKSKSKKKTEEAPVAEEAKTETPTAETPSTETSPETPTEKTDDDKQGVTKKTEYETLSGPKILGKVDLSSIKSKPTDYSDIIKGGDDKKKPRKRIYTSDQKKPGDTTAPRRPGGPYQGQGSGTGTQPPRTGPSNFTPRTGTPNYPPRRPGESNRGAYDKSKDNRGATSNQPQEVSEKQIQDKIKETMARLSGGGPQRTKGTKADYRRAKRKEVESEQQSSSAEGKEVVSLTEFVSVAELASLLNVPIVEVIKKCMALGIIYLINQRLDAEIIELVAHEFGKDVSFINMEDQEDTDAAGEDDEDEVRETRAPIVTIMGHVDHGKTSLLDYIREANVVAGEKGGITQHIGAYEVTKGDKKIAFLDTPGHEAFTAMRARGAKITDIAVIVIAADDSIMPQTKEAISHAQAAGVPIIFAFNKMDKPGANADKIREQLSSQNILVEEWGGKFQTQEISAKTGLNVDILLEKILLEAELLDLKANEHKHATGSVIEATLDKGRGYVTTVLVQDGTLNIGDVAVAGSNFGRIKAMYNERGARVTTAGPSTPVQILGLDGAPQAGEKFKAYEDEQEAKQIAVKRQQIVREQGIRTKKHITLDEIGRRLALGNFKELNIIVKADFDGSVEALSDSLLKLSTSEIQINIVFRSVGQITESDVLLATASDAIIIGFQVRPSAGARKIAEKENIEIRLYSIIYDAIDEIKNAMEGMLEPKIEEKMVGNIEIREVFKITKVGTVAGCYVTEGKITRQTKIHIIRDGIVTYTGELSSLKRYKDDVKDVTAGMECGLTIKNFNDIKVGDIVEGYEEIEVKRTL